MDEFQRRLERDGNPAKKEKAMKSAMMKASKTRVCFYCKKPDHLQRNCRKLLEAKKEENSSSSSSGTKPKKSDSLKAKAVLSDSRGIAFVVNGENCRSWIIDSGASAHMTCDKSFLPR